MADATVSAVLQGKPSTDLLVRQGAFQLWKVFDAEVVNATAVVDSIVSASDNGFFLSQFHFFGLHIIGSDAGVVDYDIQILQSWDDAAANFVVPAVNGTVASAVGDKLAHVYSVQRAPMPYLRIRVTGVGANSATTVITAYLWMQS